MRVRSWLGVAVLGALLGWSGVSVAQNPWTCKHSYPNRSGTPEGTPITVGIAATTVIAANTSLCKAVVTNMSQLDSIMCRPIGTDPTDTTGYEVLPYQVYSLDQDSQLGLRCIRSATAANDVVVTVMEYEP